MPYNPAIHHRRSIRLKGYDYSQAGLYFITICVLDRECFFGEIRDGEMVLNDAGIMVNKWWQKIPEKFPDIEMDVYQIMPNHFHAIVNNNGTGVGANPCVRPMDDTTNNIVGVDPCVNPTHMGQDFAGYSGQTRGSAPTPDTDRGIGNGDGGADSILGEHGNNILGEHGNNILGEHVGSPLHRVVQWFKTMTTNEYIRGVKTLGWTRFNRKLWQRNYWEHIIRNEQEYQRIADYIINNPARWQDDKLYNNE